MFDNPSNNVFKNSNSNYLNFPTTNNLIVYNQHSNVVDYQFNVNTINNEIIKVTDPTIDLHDGSNVNSKSTVDTQLVNHSATNHKSTKLYDNNYTSNQVIVYNNHDLTVNQSYN